MKQLSGVELFSLMKELKEIERSKVDKIYEGEGELLFQFHKTGKGKQLLRLLVGKALFLTSEKAEMDTPGRFGMQLRKHLGGTFLDLLEQITPERILKLVFSAKDVQFRLYIEFFGKGNVVLCDANNTILGALYYHEYRDRTIKVKETYKHPVMRHDVFSLSEDDLTTVLSRTDMGSVVKCLAVDLGLGGKYAEEVCALAGLDKGMRPGSMTESQEGQLFKALRGLLDRPLEPVVLVSDPEDGGAKDVLPFPLQGSEGETKAFPSFSEALEYYAHHAVDTEGTSFDSRVEETRRIIAQQERTIAKYEEEERENREKAEMIYSNYQLVSEILSELKKAEKTHSWHDIKVRLKGHATIKEVNPKEKSVVVEF